MTPILFSSPAAFFAALLGPPQHDAHVERWRGESWLRARREGSADGLAAVDDFVANCASAKHSGWRETHGYDTAALAASFIASIPAAFQTAVCADTRPTIAPRDRDRVRAQG